MHRLLDSVHVLFQSRSCCTFALLKFTVACTGLHWFALVRVGCSRDAMQPIRVHNEIEVYSGICVSICPLVVMYVELLASRLA